MRLVYRIVLHMSWALSLLLAGWAVLFYLTMIDEINDEVDDSLENYAEMLVTRSLAGRELPAAYSGSNNGYYLHDGGVRRRAAPDGVLGRGVFHSRQGRRRAGAGAADDIPRQRGTLQGADRDDPDHRKGRPAGGHPLVDRISLSFPVADDPAGQRAGASSYPAAALCPAAMVRQLYRGREERPAGERHEGHRVPAAERGGEPLCRAGGVPVRTPETIHRQCLA